MYSLVGNRGLWSQTPWLCVNPSSNTSYLYDLEQGYLAAPCLSVLICKMGMLMRINIKFRGVSSYIQSTLNCAWNIVNAQKMSVIIFHPNFWVKLQTNSFNLRVILTLSQFLKNLFDMTSILIFYFLCYSSA